MNPFTLQRKLMRDAQTAFILTHGAAAFWLWSRYWAWVEGNWKMAEEMMGDSNGS